MPPPQFEAESSERVSIDSMNNVSSPGRQGRVLTDEPDFIVVKAGFEYGGDLALAVVEVKKKHEKIRGWIGIRLYNTCATFRTRILHLI